MLIYFLQLYFCLLFQWAYTFSEYEVFLGNSLIDAFKKIVKSDV